MGNDGGVNRKVSNIYALHPKTKETYLPSGIPSPPADARKRWEADQWRYPPYQYRTEYCLRRISPPHELRLLCAEEREVLMFLGKGVTKYAINPTKAQENPVELEDVRCSLVGTLSMQEW